MTDDQEDMILGPLLTIHGPCLVTGRDRQGNPLSVDLRDAPQDSTFRITLQATRDVYCKALAEELEQAREELVLARRRIAALQARPARPRRRRTRWPW